MMFQVMGKLIMTPRGVLTISYYFEFPFGKRSLQKSVLINAT